MNLEFTVFPGDLCKLQLVLAIPLGYCFKMQRAYIYSSRKQIFFFLEKSGARLKKRGAVLD